MGLFRDNWKLILGIIFPVYGLAQLVIKHWGKISEAVKNLLGKVVGLFRDNWKLILGVIFPVYGLAQLVIKHWGKIVEVVNTIWNNVYSTVTGWINAIVEFVNELPGRILEIIQKIPSMVGNVIKDIPVIGDAVGAVGGAVGGGSRAYLEVSTEASSLAQRSLSWEEAGPEAVIPLPNAGMVGNGTTIIVEGPIYGFDDFAAKVQEATLLGARRGRQDLLR